MYCLEINLRGEKLWFEQIASLIDAILAYEAKKAILKRFLTHHVLLLHGLLAEQRYSAV